MTSKRTPATTLIIRLLLAAACAYAGWRMVASVQGWNNAFLALFGVLLLLVPPAILLAEPVAGLFGWIFHGAFTPGTGLNKPEPRYSTPRAMRSRGQFMEAMGAYQSLVAQFPQELPAYHAMVEIAAFDLKDLPMALAIAQQGLATLEDEQDRNSLRRNYQESTGEDIA